VPEVPAIPTTLEQAQETLAEIVMDIRKVDIAGLVDSVRDAAKSIQTLASTPGVAEAVASLDQTLDAVRDVARSLDQRVGPLGRELDASLAELRRTFGRVEVAVEDVRSLLAPDAPLPVEAVGVLSDLRGAARAVQRLADMLEEHPSSIVFGKPEP
jgi:hypothetical protein